MKIVKNTCSLDCFDVCKIDVHVKENKVVKLQGSKENDFTNGFLCPKGLKHLDRLYDKNRIIKPLLKIGEGFKEISFDEALDIIADKISNIKNNFNTNSIVHYSESGAGGLLKSIHNNFFNFLGGITTTSGGTCWSAGCAAHDYDFGGRKTSDLDDMVNSDVIILWSRNPASTSIHLYKKILDMKKLGKKIITIDFRNNETSKASDLHLNVNGGTDGALALALCKYFYSNSLIDYNFSNNMIIGLKEFISHIDSLDLDMLLQECGISSNDFSSLVSFLKNKKIMTFIGYGLQKYINGGNTVRCIDAFMSITGNIGKSGCGVFYSSKIYPNVLNRDPFNSEKYALNSREFPITDFYKVVPENNIQAIFISKANPLNQLPDLNKTLKAYTSIPFKVCFDMFMTDTAKNSDLIIPVTNTLESEDIIYSSMLMPYLMYNEAAVDPDDYRMDEYEFFKELAKLLHLENYPQLSKTDYLNEVLKPLDITLDTLKEKDINIEKGYIAWGDLKFKTPSGKIELYSETALKDGFDPMPIFKKATSGTDEYPIRLITPHSKDSLFNQHIGDINSINQIYISKHNLDIFKTGDKVLVKSKNGEILSEINIDLNLKKDEAYIFMKWSSKQGNPNFLTDSLISDIGGQVAYYDTFIKIEKVN